MIGQSLITCFTMLKNFHYVSFSTDPTGNKCNVYVNRKMDIIPNSSNVQDLGITMSSDCTFNVHIKRNLKDCPQKLKLKGDSLFLLGTLLCVGM